MDTLDVTTYMLDIYPTYIGLSPSAVVTSGIAATIGTVTIGLSTATFTALGKVFVVSLSIIGIYIAIRKALKFFNQIG